MTSFWLDIRDRKIISHLHNHRMRTHSRRIHNKV